MPHVAPLRREELRRYEPAFQLVEAFMGFVPRSLFTMGHRPPLLEAFLGLASTVQTTDQLDPGLVQLVAHIASTAAGCRYCQAHTGAHAARHGVPDGKLAAAWEFETSDLFDEAERAALRLARDAALSPNATTPAHFEDLRRHWTERQIVDLVAIVSLFGFLNRWNDTMATELEDEPAAFGARVLAGRGWEVGKHVADVDDAARVPTSCSRAGSRYRGSSGSRRRP
jgi:AhpD family alkylhydroperoxidase